MKKNREKERIANKNAHKTIKRQYAIILIMKCIDYEEKYEDDDGKTVFTDYLKPLILILLTPPPSTNSLK